MLTFKCGVVEFVILGSVIGVFDDEAGELLVSPAKLGAGEKIKVLFKEKCAECKKY